MPCAALGGSSLVMAPAGTGMAETQGTSALSLYNANPAGAMPGGAMAENLHDRDMAIRQKMAMPTPGADMSRPSGAPEWYNYSGMQPAKYSVPSDMKDRMVAKAAIREAAALLIQEYKLRKSASKPDQSITLHVPSRG